MEALYAMMLAIGRTTNPGPNDPRIYQSRKCK
jgi:hypothetical protein